LQKNTALTGINAPTKILAEQSRLNRFGQNCDWLLP
jgi:hypothetical protein